MFSTFGKLCTILLLSTILFSCGGGSNGSNYTATLSNCAVEDSEIQLLNQFFDIFDQKMRTYYQCENTKDGLHYLILNFDNIQDDGRLFELTNEEERIIQEYNDSPTFTKYRSKGGNLNEDNEDIREIFLPATYQAYGDCLTKHSDIMKDLYDRLSMVGAISTHLIAYYFVDEIGESKSKIDSATGMGIFINLYLFVLLDSQDVEDFEDMDDEDIEDFDDIEDIEEDED